MKIARARLVAAAAASLLLTACAPAEAPRFPHAIVTAVPAKPLPPFVLRARAGELGPAALAGRWTWVYFGFANCPDVCPAALDDLAGEHKRLDRPERVRMLFVSVDPGRDTPEKLAEFARYYDPAFVGATGPKRDIDAFTRALGAGYVIDPPPTPGGPYNVSHSNMVFVLDPQGHYAATYVPGAKPGDLAADMNALLKEETP